MDIDSFWEYSDPAESEARFREVLKTATGDEQLELLTQIARTYSLRGMFEQAHKILDELEGRLDGTGPRPQIRYCLERGRTFNSNGNSGRAANLFQKAWKLAQAARQEGLAVDAAHMLAIVYSGSPQAGEWYRRGLSLARSSRDPKARALIPALLNNAAWDLHDSGRFEEALPLFEDALNEWTARGQKEQIWTARWSLARCLRSLGRCEQALSNQHLLEAERAAADSVDGYVFEEIAENLDALGKADQALVYFKKAADELGKDDWFVQNEAARLARLQARAGQ